MSWLFKNEHEFKNHSNGCCCRLLVTFNWSKINKNWPKINKNSIKLVTIQQNWSKMNQNWPKIYKNERKSVKNQSNWSKFNKNSIKSVKIQQNWSKIGQKSTKFQPNVPIIEDFFKCAGYQGNKWMKLNRQLRWWRVWNHGNGRE